MSAKGLIFCVHNHQPVDNFDVVFQETCIQAYEPFINAMDRHPSVKFCAHYSGPLLQWIQKNRLDLFIKIRGLVDRGQLELLAGGFYEPPISMLSEKDALGQVSMMVEYLHKNFGVEPKGMWLAERIWEPQLASLLCRTGLRYTVLDDAHFRAAGLEDSRIHGHFLTEDEGELFRIFPIRENLRYCIPWKDPQETVKELRACPDGAIVTYADDGEKFGGWPETRKHVYEDGWLERFLELIQAERTCTFAEVLEEPSQGRVYLPTCSYREMGEWSLHPSGQERLASIRERLEKAGEFGDIGPFLTGGTWRNFRAKYPEANMMYGRMVDVSRRVAESKSAKAREELYQAQCNDAYWHGVFGGLYLPSLRDSVYRHLIRAENALEKKLPATDHLDLNLDGDADIRLTNPDLSLFFSPQQGGQLLEIDVRKPAVNIGATLSRRLESYHAKLLEKMRKTGRATDFERHLVYDAHPRTSLVEHFLAPGGEVPGCGEDLGDFVGAPFTGRAARREKQRVATFVREGTVSGVPVRMEKSVLVPAEGAEFQVSYTLKASQPLKARFAVEFNFGLLSPEGFGPAEPGGTLYLIHDSYHDLQIRMMAAAVAGFGIHPFRTISQSEKEYDLNYQGTAVVPHWDLDLDAGGTWQGVVTVKIED